MASIMEALVQKIDIVDLISETVELRQSSRGYTGKCPLHQGDGEATLWVTGDNQRFHCFSCGNSGNAIQWFKKLHNLAFYEAINKLCEAYNIDLSNNRSYQEERNLVEEFTKQAYALHKKVEGISEYLIGERQLTQESIDLHKLGYSVEKNAISIPLIDVYGRVMAMAFRNMDNDARIKYVNSKNNDLYDKSYYLYNLVNARKLIKSTGRLWMVEGYFCAMSGQIQGEAMVSYNSASINKGHVLEVKNSLVDHKNIEVILAADADEPGQSKIAKMREKFRKYYPKVNLRVAVYPDGCKDINDVHCTGLKISEMETVAVDMFVLKQMLSQCKSIEEQYATAQEFIHSVPNELIKSDIAEYLSVTWKKPLEKIEAMLSVKVDSKDEKLKKLASFDDSFADLKESILGEKKGLGYAQIDHAMNGTRPKENLVIAGYTSSGKSTVAIKIAANRIIRYHENIVYFSLEMSKGMVLEQIIMEVLECNTYKLEELIKSDAGIELYQKVKGIVEKHLRIVDDPNTTVEEIEEYIELCNNEVFDENVHTFVLDHFHLLDGAEEEKIAVKLANKIGAVVKKCNVNSIILAQFNEASQSNVKLGKYTEAHVGDIKGSNALKAIAHTILLVWRLFYSYTGRSKIETDAFKYITRIKIGKHRRNVRGSLYYDLEYDPETTKMTERKELFQLATN